MSGFHDNVLLGASGSQGYQISRSVRLRSSASAYFNRTLTTPTDAKKWTWSGWVKRGILGASPNLFWAWSGSGNEDQLMFSTDTLRFYVNGGTTGNIITSAVFRDPSSWYHIIAVYDSANATSNDRMILYVNGVRQALSTNTQPTLNYSNQFNTAVSHSLGRNVPAATYFDGYLTEVNFIDGQALTPSSFGETDVVTGVWKPKKYTGTYGTNGFYLNFSDNSAATAAAIGKDNSGNGNNWTPNNISVTAGATYDSMLDVPTQWADGGNGRGNYATLSPIDNNNGTLSSGNLNLSIPAGVSSSGFGNFAMTAGKWYWEVIPTNGSVFASMIGVSDQSAAATNRTYTTANGWGYYSAAQTYYNNTPASYGATFTTNDVIGVAYDADIGSLSFYKNGVSQGVAFSTNLFGKPIIPAFFNGTSSNAQTFVANFGQRPFAYTPPSGFKALNTLNLPTPTILKGNQYFDATTYTGNASTNTIVNAGGFQPDLVWLKSRSAANNHTLFDSVRGANNILYPNLTNAAAAVSQYLNSFNSNGFTLGANENSNDSVGESSVGWQWKEGATQGFDIVTYTESAGVNTIPHSLGVTPKMFITKRRDGVENWVVWFTGFANTEAMYLNGTAAKSASGSAWISLNSSNVQVTSGQWTGTGNKIAYLFAEVAGFSRFGTYTGNGSTDGPFVFCGFRPRFLMFKRTDAAAQWLIIDTARSPYNQTNEVLLPSASAAEANGAGYGAYDILSNGFKPRNVVANDTNVSGGTYIFAAFAEFPFKNALAR